MFPTYAFLTATIIILTQITDSTDFNNSQDSSYFPWENHNLALIASRRYRRQSFGTCQIPGNPRHNKYKVLSQFESTYKPGDAVPSYTAVQITCDEGYKLSPVVQNISLCINGVWTPALSNCLRACPSLKSIASTSVKCTHGVIPLDNCYDPVEETTVLLTCNPLYEESNIQHNPIHLCSVGQWDPPIPQCYPICGEKRPQGRVNIINGSNTDQGNYPWHIGIYNALNQEYLCGGSLINPNIILSAAHCFSNEEGVSFPSENYVVAAGKYHRHLNDHRDFFTQRSRLKEIRIPDHYRGRTTFQALDIAVLVLKSPFVLSTAVQPVCIELNEASLQVQLSLNDGGIVTGWGLTQEGGDLADVLKEVIIPYIPFDKCYNEIPTSFRKFFSPDKICGGYLNSGTGVCGGDSGGGYVFNQVIRNRYFVKGVVSTSPTTVELQCDANQYSLYTSVVSHIEFVRSIITYNRLRYYIECRTDRCTNELDKPEEETELKPVDVDDRYNLCCGQPDKCNVYSTAIVPRCKYFSCEPDTTCKYFSYAPGSRCKYFSCANGARCEYFSCSNNWSLFERMVDMLL